MDTGADVTILPREAIEQMGIKPVENKAYEVEGFDGKTSLVEVVEVELLFPGKKFKGQFLLMDQPIGIMGRNIMNAVSLILDGPKGFRDEKLA